VSHPQRKTIGLRVPDHKVLQACSNARRAAAGHHADGSAAKREPLNDAQEIRDRFEQ
jgi:tRNA A37 threonylcarbamoyladenosine synthetase subunit TsaC/SUA5/YrdC